MTKFILHGGRVNVPSEDNRRFFATITSGLNDGDKVLLVYFSRDEKDWPEFYEVDKKNFSDTGKQLRLEVADIEPSKLKEQIKTTDAVYVRGGSTFKLLEQIRLLPDFAGLIKSKIYAGSSAGVYLICKYFYENDYDKVGEGLGILPYQAFAHWDENKADQLKKLTDIGGALPILKLHEGEHIVMEQ